MQEAAYRDSGSQIHRNQAAKLITGNVLALHLRCPAFSRPGTNWLRAYTWMLNQSCSEDDFFTGCADQNYVDRQEVENCRMLIDADPCEWERFAGGTLRMRRGRDENQTQKFVGNRRLCTFAL